MTKDEIRTKIDELIAKGDWYDITHLCKDDESGYALHYLATAAIYYYNTVDLIKKII